MDGESSVPNFVTTYISILLKFFITKHQNVDDSLAPLGQPKNSHLQNSLDHYRTSQQKNGEMNMFYPLYTTFLELVIIKRD